MQPSSILSKEQAKMLSNMLDQKYGSSLDGRYFIVEGKSDGETVQLQVTLRDQEGRFVYPVEARMATVAQDLSASEARDLLLDFIDSYFEEYLTQGLDTYLTIDWSNYDCDGFELQMRGQIQNELLEQAANDLIEGRTIDLGKIGRKGLLH